MSTFTLPISQRADVSAQSVVDKLHNGACLHVQGNNCHVTYPYEKRDSATKGFVALSSELVSALSEAFPGVVDYQYNCGPGYTSGGFSDNTDAAIERRERAASRAAAGARAM